MLALWAAPDRSVLGAGEGRRASSALHKPLADVTAVDRGAVEVDGVADVSIKPVCR